ncbi:MAG: hypothetical protein J6C84_00470 [Lachnospiraceae bacterium]|nr:hypothetical protein [Lachnospiraceae bacterium]
MWEGYYGKEPFDLRLTVLRLMRNLPGIIAVTLLGTLLFGGGYYVKNVLLRDQKEYSVTSTYKVEYVEEPAKSGDYYINEMSWNTYVQSYEFLSAVQEHLARTTASEKELAIEIDTEALAAMISAKLPSDWHIPTTTVVTDDDRKSLLIAQAVEAAMTEDLTDIATELKRVSVMDPGRKAQELVPDVRPLRAVILSAILSLFFALTIYLIGEIGADSIWLPATLHNRYGLVPVGTIKSRELAPNLAYRFQGMGKAALCAVDEDIDPLQVADALQDTLQDGGQDAASKLSWIPVPAPLLCAESAEFLRGMEGVLLVVKAGKHVGKPLEHVLEYLGAQDVKVTAVLLWEADEKLIRAYYLLPGGNRV